MECPNCNCLVASGKPDEKEYRSWCFVCKKYVTIHNTEPVKMKTKSDFFISDYGCGIGQDLFKS